MQDIVLNALKREQKSKKFRKHNSKQVPGVVYGKDQEPVSIAMDSVELHKAFYEAGGNKVVDLKIEGTKEPVKVLFHEVQEDPVLNTLIHFDLYAVTLGQKMQVDVPINIINDDHLHQHEGVLTTIRDTLEIEANPLDLPESIEVDASSLQEIGDLIVIGDLTAGKDATFVEEDDRVVLKLDAPREEEPEEDLEPADPTAVASEHGGDAEEGEEAEDDSGSDSGDEEKTE